MRNLKLGNLKLRNLNFNVLLILKYRIFLLQECGRVVRWARTLDPSTKKLSTFGFCEFESPLGVIRAVRSLNGLQLDGQQLVANCEVNHHK